MWIIFYPHREWVWITFHPHTEGYVGSLICDITGAGCQIQKGHVSWLGAVEMRVAGEIWFVINPCNLSITVISNAYQLTHFLLVELCSMNWWDIQTSSFHWWEEARGKNLCTNQVWFKSTIESISFRVVLVSYTI
jgi:hypothetical protein